MGIRNDPQSPFVTSGLRIGVPAVTTRGFTETEMVIVGNLIADIILHRDDEEIFSAIYYKPEFSQWLHNNDTKWPFHHDNHMKHFNNSLKYWNRFNIDTVEKMEIFIKLIYQDPKLLAGDF